MKEIHCENIIHDYYNYPGCIRYFVLINRMSAVDKNLIVDFVGEPKCFATWKDKRVRLTMASRLGDIGITEDLESIAGYEHRVNIVDLTDFSLNKDDPNNNCNACNKCDDSDFLLLSHEQFNYNNPIGK